MSSVYISRLENVTPAAPEQVIEKKDGRFPTVLKFVFLFCFLLASLALHYYAGMLHNNKYI